MENHLAKEEFVGSEIVTTEMPTISYVPQDSTTNNTTRLHNMLYSQHTQNQAYPGLVGGPQQGLQGLAQGLLGYAPGLTQQAIPTQHQQEEKQTMARLIHYVAVDPTPVLADKAPSLCVLMEGTVVLNGTDDRGFLMELAPQLAERLIIHNPRRANIDYEDKDGKTQNLKPIKLSNIDVVIQTLKEYR